MLLGLALLLATVGVAVFPRWHYSQRWGYLPAATVGTLLVAVAVAAAAGRPGITGIRIAEAPSSATVASWPDQARRKQTVESFTLWSHEPGFAALPGFTSLD